MTSMMKLATVVAALATATTANAGTVEITVRIQNLAPTNSISFAPLRFGFNNGTFDAFNTGETATAPIISVAEGGTAVDWFPAFAAADPTAVLGSSTGPLTPGIDVTTMAFRVNTAVNPFFTFASMVVPSNDLFIGNDDPMEYRLFDAAGNLILNSIDQNADEIWNAGSETADPLNAAFVVGGNNDLRTAENGVVGFSFDELAAFNGLTTAAGYTYDNSLLSRTTPIFRISFSAVSVPEPSTWAMMILGFGVVGSALRRAKRVRVAPLTA